MPNLSIIFGHFMRRKVWMPLVGLPSGLRTLAEVIKFDEKGSDVNLATHLLNDGWQGEYEVAVVVSNDADLLSPIKTVREKLGLCVGVIIPGNQQSDDLIEASTFCKKIRMGLLGACQFPDTLVDEKGTFHKPPSFAEPEGAATPPPEIRKWDCPVCCGTGRVDCRVTESPSKTG